MPPVAFVPVDFDEQTADDWDVDMSVYYDRGTERGVAVPGRSCALVLYTSHTCLSEAKLGDLLLYTHSPCAQGRWFYNPHGHKTCGRSFLTRWDNICLGLHTSLRILKIIPLKKNNCQAVVVNTGNPGRDRPVFVRVRPAWFRK